MKNVKREIRCLALALVALCLVSCGGGGGSGNDASSITGGPSTAGGSTTYAVHGKVNGLVAPITIRDGFESLSITSDTDFSFQHRYNKGETFSITVDTGGADQLCTLTHGSGLILSDINDVSVDCLETRAANVHVTKPDFYKSFSSLDIQSTYQNQQLSSDTATLVVAKYQFISLVTHDAPAKPIYLALVKSFDEIIDVNSISTAEALVLLSPSIHNAIEERGGDFARYTVRLSQLDAVNSFAQALKTAADAGKLDLSQPDSDTLALLDAAIVAAAADIISVGDHVKTKSVAQKLSATPVSGSAGSVNFTLESLAIPDAQGNNLDVTVANNAQRYIAVDSPLLAQALNIDPNAAQKAAIKSTDISNGVWTVRGPGAQAVASPSASFKQAVIDTATKFYALPSIGFEVGRLDNLDLRLLACVDAQDLQSMHDSIDAALIADNVFTQALQGPQYTAAYNGVTYSQRAAYTNRISDLLACDMFRKGHWLADHIGTASSELTLMSKISQAYYAPRLNSENVMIQFSGLLSAGDVINNNMTEQQWQLANTLGIHIVKVVGTTQSDVAGTVAINQGDHLTLKADCIDPSNGKAVSCTFHWQSSQTGVDGAGFDADFPDAGNFVVTVSAQDADGASASVDVTVAVHDLTPKGALQASDGTPITQSSYTYPFGEVAVGSSRDAVFTLTNVGDDTLFVDAPQVSTPFSIASISASQLAPGASAKITARFSPTNATPFNAVISLPLHGSQVKYTNTLQFNLSGTGFVVFDQAVTLTNSYWQQSDGNSTNQYNLTSGDVLDDAVNQVLVFRAFVAAPTTYPQISITLPAFSDLRTTQTYNLDDLSNRSCLGYVLFGSDPSHQWCTKTNSPFNTQRATGTATYSAGAHGQSIVEFSFDVVPEDCSLPPCSLQHVSGRFEVR